MSTTLLILLAFVPGLLIALFIYLRDMREPEPYSLLLMSVILWGCCVFSFAWDRVSVTQFCLYRQ